MPIQYTGILAEHDACRTRAVVFDTCHMGEFYIRGEHSVADLESLVSCPVADMKEGTCRYGYLLNNAGGVLDDQILYRMSTDSFMMVVNASTAPADAAWIQSHVSAHTMFEDASDRTAKIDLQGPLSAKIAAKISEKSIESLAYYSFINSSFESIPLLISRTGYTGEIGFELYCDVSAARKLWDLLIALGAEPAGLGARDTLRLEMGYPLYGHELNATRNAQWAGFHKALAVDKTFIGAQSVRNAAIQTHSLVGIMLSDRRSARDHDALVNNEGVVIGEVTSGSYSPSCGCGIALGYVENARALVGTKIGIQTARGVLPATVEKLPLYKQATGKKKLKEFL